MRYRQQDIGHTYGEWCGMAYMGPVDGEGKPKGPLGPGEKAQVLIVGNNNQNSSHHCKIVTMDVETGALTSEVLPCPLIPTNIQALSAVRVGKEILIFGGYSGGSYLNSMYSFDIETRAFTKVPQSGCWPGARERHAAFALGGMMIIAGGQNSSQNDVWSFDPSTRKFTQLGNMPCDMSYSASAVIGDTAHLVGANCNNYQTHLTYTSAGGWVKRSDTGFQMFGGSALAVGSDIIAISGNNHANQVH
ncbi:hypothetical protein KIPB_013508, partial [Kipferlia bialata]|eukprot:g13508.t1